MSDISEAEAFDRGRECGKREAIDEIERLRAALREIAAVPTCPGAERQRLIMIAREALGE